MPIAPEPRTCFVDVGHGWRNVVERGFEDAPVLLLQHGMRDHARSREWVAAALGDGFRIIAPDLRRHGDSNWSQPISRGIEAILASPSSYLNGKREVHA